MSEEREEVPFHELPPKAKVMLHDGIGCMIPSGASLEVWRIKERDGFKIKIRRALEDGRVSTLDFSLTLPASIALHSLLGLQIYPEPPLNRHTNQPA